MKTALLAFLLLCCTQVWGVDKLVTPSYEVTIDVRCAEGVVGCDRIRFTGLDRKTGKSITLNGREVHTRCADGVTPCRFLGYVFNRGNTVYWVGENGFFSIKQGKRELLLEEGEWDWDR